MAALPEWKLQLLERKKREEEEGRRREVELQERLSKMPTWKREIIERRRAKLGSGASFSETGEGVGGFPQQGGSFQGPWPGMLPTQSSPEEDHSAVLQEKIGPVHQNPFIKLEKQRKESADGDPGTKARHMADLYSQLPGVRTIRAENIIIIESDPRFFQLDGQREESKSKSVEALNSMVAAGHPREIHANEVLIIKSSLSRSVEDLNSINRSQEDSSTPGRPRKGQVSQLLSKFGQEKSGWSRTARSLSTEHLGEKTAQESYEDDTFSAEPPGGHCLPLTISRHETNGQLKAYYDGRTPTSPSSLPSPTNCRTRSPIDLRSPLSSSSDEARTRGHSLSPSRSLPPQHKVAPFQSQVNAKSLDVHSPDPPCRSPSPHTPRPWQKDCLRHVEAGEEPPQKLTPTHNDWAMPAEEATPLGGAPNSMTVIQGAQDTGSFHDDEGGLVEPSWRSHLVAPLTEQQQKEGEMSSPPRSSRQSGAERNCEEDTAPSPGSGPPSPVAVPSLHPSSPSDNFEALPDPIPEGDLPRLQSRNASVIVPRRRPSPPPEHRPSPSPGPAQEAGALPLPKAPAPGEPTASCPAPAPGTAPQARNAPGLERPEARLLRSPEAQEPPEDQPPNMSRLYNLKAALPQAAKARPDDGRPAPFSLRTPGACFYQPPGAPGPQEAAARRGGGGGEPPRAMSSHPAMQRKSGNTITIQPRRPPPAAGILENGAPAVALETEAPAATEAARSIPGKKRYPTADEIQVIGGYLALERSCLSRSDPRRRKMELSFSEGDLERVFEYPSEDSLLEEFGPPEESDNPPANAQADDDDEEEVLLPQNGLAGARSVGSIMRTKPLIVDESCRR